MAGARNIVLDTTPLDAREDQVNRSFLDLLVRRVELRLEMLTYERFAAEGQIDVATRDAQRMDIRPRLADVEVEQEKILASRRKGKTRLPIYDLFEVYDLSEAEREVFAFALAPQLDSSVRRRYARYNDNILLDYPDVQFLVSLIGGSRDQALAARALFDHESVLVAHKLVALSVPRDLSGEHFLGWEVRPPERLVEYVLGRFGLDRSLREYCTVERPATALDEVVLPEDVVSEVLGIVDRFPEYRKRRRARAERAERAGKAPDGAIVLQFSGPPGTGKTLFTQAVAARMDKPLLRVNCAKLNLDDKTLRSVLDNLFFEAALRDAVLCLEAAETLFVQKSPKLPTFFEHFEEHDGLVILNATDPRMLDGTLERWVVYQLDFELPEPALRERIWALELPDDIPWGDDVDLQILANQYDVTGFQIRNAVVVATNRALAQSPDEPVLTSELLQKAAHAQLRASMDEYSKPSKIKLRLDDLILPDREMVLVQEVLNAARVRVFVMNKWGFGSRLVTGKGIVSLFVGEPGTGKTLCAEILANELSLNLYQISIPRVMSKYIGETEKNIEKIFSTARANQSMLLFDEADALFTSRVKVETSVDRFSNMEVNLLLQEIERFEGVVILTTNLDKNIDKAFQRRINFRINFPFPEKEYRARIWAKLLPRECPLADEVDFDELGEYFELSGGHIKNAVIRAAYRAYGLGRSISYEDFLFAAEQECKAAGRIFRRPEDLD